MEEIRTAISSGCLSISLVIIISAYSIAMQISKLREDLKKTQSDIES